MQTRKSRESSEEGNKGARGAQDAADRGAARRFRASEDEDRAGYGQTSQEEDGRVGRRRQRRGHGRRGPSGRRIRQAAVFRRWWKTTIQLLEMTRLEEELAEEKEREPGEALQLMALIGKGYIVEEQIRRGSGDVFDYVQ